MATSEIQGETEVLETVPDYSGLNVVEALPLSRFCPEGGEALLHGMAGATIMRIGSTDEDGIEGGGLIVDYRPAGTAHARRVVFGFTELGMWIEWDGEISIPA